MKPDDVCEKYSDSIIKLSILKNKNFIVIKGDSCSLKFLSELISAQADTLTNSGFSISPKGAGSSYFVKKSKLGLYINNNEAIP